MERRLTLVRSGSERLSQAGIINHAGESELFLSHTLGCQRVELYLDNLTVGRPEQKYFWRLISQRSKGIPLQHLVGSTEFMGLEFQIRKDVFIPRPETEILVETVLNYSLSAIHYSPKVLDLGSGCGNIAVSIAKYLSGIRVFACDISDNALKLSKVNSDLHKADIALFKSDLFSACRRGSTFSLIVSNPPYIETQKIPALARELQHEPNEALDGGEDGLDYYRRIINEAGAYLQKKGMLVLELGDNHLGAVVDIFARSHAFTLVEIVKDYNGTDRVIVARSAK